MPSASRCIKQQPRVGDGADSGGGNGNNQAAVYLFSFVSAAILLQACKRHTQNRLKNASIHLSAVCLVCLLHVKEL